MTLLELLNIWPGTPLLSAFFWITLSVFLLYLARRGDSGRTGQQPQAIVNDPAERIDRPVGRRAGQVEQKNA